MWNPLPVGEEDFLQEFDFENVRNHAKLTGWWEIQTELDLKAAPAKEGAKSKASPRKKQRVQLESESDESESSSEESSNSVQVNSSDFPISSTPPYESRSTAQRKSTPMTSRPTQMWRPKDQTNPAGEPCLTQKTAPKPALRIHPGKGNALRRVERPSAALSSRCRANSKPKWQRTRSARSSVWLDGVRPSCQSLCISSHA